MEQLSLEEIHLETLNTMQKIHEICEEIGLNYYLMFGTLLGAVRHGGFIPWDDDLDVAMMRKDFDKFVNYCLINETSLKPYKLCTKENTINYPYNIPRFANMNYKYVNLDNLYPQFDNGLFVDIYPLDNFANNKNTAYKIIRKTDLYNKLYVVYLYSSSNENIFRSKLKKLVHCTLNIIYKKNFSKVVNDKIMNTINKYTSDNDKYVGVPSWAGSSLFQYERKWFQERQLINFSGRFFWIMKDYDEVLKVLYGNYMKLPPEEKRFPHHNYIIYKKI